MSETKLELKITANAKQALDSLDGLEKALQRVRAAVGKGLGLSKAAKEIDNFTKSIQNSVNAGTVEHLNKLALALERLQKFSGFKMPDLKSFAKYQKYMESIASGKASKEIDKTGRSLGDIAKAAGEVENTSQALIVLSNAVKNVTSTVSGTAQTAVSTYVRELGMIPEIARQIDRTSLSTRLRGVQGLPPSPDEWKQNAISGEGYVVDPDTIPKISAACDLAVSDLGRVNTAMQTLIDTGNELSTFVRQARLMPPEMEDWKQNAIPAEFSIDPIEEATDAMHRFAESMEESTFDAEELGAATSELEDVIGDTEDETKQATKTINAFKEKLKQLFSTAANGKRHMNGLLSSFTRIARNMAIRAVIKEIAKGFKEGFDNMYQYAKLTGHTLAPAVDSANNALFKMKNSIGAALAPAVQMLIPYVIQLVNWFINLVNIVNQFLALLRGQSSWTRATNAPATTLDKVKDSAKGASSAVKELKGLLADWDELNIIQQETGGGGGSGGSTKADEDMSKYGLLFEEVNTFDQRVQSLFNRFKEIVAWIQEHMDQIKTIALEIGAAILAWKLSKSFGGVLGILAGLATIALTAKIVFDITMMLDEEYIKTGDEGYLIANVLETALGAVIAKQLMSQLVGKENAAKGGALAAAIVLTLSATADIIAALGHTDVSALSKENLSLAVLSALKVGATAMLLAKTFGGLGIMQSGLIGVGATGLVLGAEIGLKAVLGTETDLSDITNENIEAILLGSGVFGVGVAGLTKMFGKTVGASALKTGLGATVGTGLALAAAIDLKALLSGKVDADKIDEVSVRSALLSTASIASYVYTGATQFLKQGRGQAAGTAAATAIATGLAISAALDIKALLSGKVDDSEITEKKVISTLKLSAALASLGIGTLKNIKSVGLSRAFGIGGAIFGTGLMVSAGIGIKAIFDENVDVSELSETAIQSLVEATGGGAIAGFSIFKGVMGYNTVQALKAAGLSAYSTFMFAAAAIGIKLVIDSGTIDTGAINEKTIGGILITSIGLGGGFGSLARLFGAGVVSAFTTGVLTTVATGLFIGAAIGIKVMLSETIDSGEITEKTITDIVKNSLLVGGGVASLAGLFGLGVVGAIGAGAIGVVATGLIMYATLSIALAAKKDGIKWGDQEATYEQIDSYVTSNMFSHEIDIKPTLKLLDVTISKAEEADENVRSALQTAMPTMEVINLGLADKGTYSTLMADMFGEDGNGGAFKAIQDDIKAKKRTITTTLTLVPVITETGENKTEEVLGAGLKALADIDEYFTNKGTEIGNLLKKGIEGSLDDLGEETLKKLLEEFNETTRAFTEGKLIGKSTSELQTSFSKYFGDGGIKDVRDLTKDSFTELVGIFSNYKKELQGGLEESYVKTAESYKGFAAFYAARGQEGDDELSKYYTGLYDDLIYSLKHGEVQNRVDELSATGKQILVDALNGLVTEDSLKGGKTFRFSQFKQFLENGYFKDMKGAITDASVASFKAKDTWKEFLWSAIGLGDFGNDLSALGINPEDILNPTTLNNLKEEFRKIILDAYWGTDSADTIINGLFGSGEISNVTEQVREAVEDTKEGFQTAESEIQNATSVINEAIDTLPSEVAGPDTSGLIQTWDNTADSVIGYIQDILDAEAMLGGVTYQAGRTGGWGRNAPHLIRGAYADGGFVTAGELFLAREAGPELVGTMGGHTAVANNEQIVTGITRGVANGQAEQNALLRQQNDYLRRILEKESTVRLEPSAAFGKVARRSEEMYARNTGR